MEDGIYHYEVYWEEEIQNQIDDVLNSGLPLRFDGHAINNKYKRKISISSINTEKLKNGYCFEAEVKKNKVVKFVIRYGYNDIYDLSSVWQPNVDCMYCRTVWLNKKNDKHVTLDENKYVKYKNKNNKHIGICLGDLINQKKRDK